jgi:hypothetical protein
MRLIIIIIIIIIIILEGRITKTYPVSETLCLAVI